MHPVTSRPHPTYAPRKDNTPRRHSPIRLLPLPCILILALLPLAAQDTDALTTWNTLEKAVRDQLLPQAAARLEFVRVYAALRRLAAPLAFARRETWAFPLHPGDRRWIGRGGFRPDIHYGSSPIKGYNFYDGNRHGGHPAYDIFIPDRNGDGLHDGDGRPVAVIAPLDLLVLSTYTQWRPGSELRGGNYVWAWYPPADLLFYFAHLAAVSVVPGERVPAGTPLGTVGRSGKNARPARSPTHLHLMVLQVRGDTLKPLDFLMRLTPPPPTVDRRP